jgi:hypothetical protein
MIKNCAAVSKAAATPTDLRWLIRVTAQQHLLYLFAYLIDFNQNIDKAPAAILNTIRSL